MTLDWGNAGSAFYAVEGRRIVALLYHADGAVGHYDEGGETYPTEAGWWLILADAPEHHGHVEAPTMTPDMADNELAAANHAALTEATKVVIRHIQGGGR